MNFTHEDLKKEFNNHFSKELFGLVTGEPIGSGYFRVVYRYALDRNYVIKFEQGAESFHNVREFDAWSAVKDKPEISKWFAPIKMISPCGSILLMEYAPPMIDLPKEVPAFFSDVCLQNWGTLRGHPVCIDYGLNNLVDMGLKNKKMRKVNWG